MILLLFTEVKLVARLLSTAGVALLCLALFAAKSGHAQSDTKVLRIVPHTNLIILDPIWTKAYITRNHGYMVYDTLFGTDAAGSIQPQMVSRWEVGKDRKVWTFTLREGLEFHDGKPVTSEDVIASLARWGKRDGLGQKLMASTDAMEAVDARRLSHQAQGAVQHDAPGARQAGANVPFVMPKRVAETPADKQIEDVTGSGPFVFAKSEWRPGDRVVYLKNGRYRPRPEEASGTAGGKVVKVDRVEWVIIKDPQTQVNALIKGEVDVVETVSYEHYSAVKSNADLQVFSPNPRGLAFWLRFNHLHPPFDNVKVRRAAMAAMNQPAFLRAQVGVPELSRTCFSVYPCSSPNFTQRGMEFIAKSDMARAQQLLKESGYEGL